MKRLWASVLCFVFLFGIVCSGSAAESGGTLGGDPSVETGGALTLDAKGAVLMEAETGTVLYELEAHQRLYPASVTKVMTMLLVMEALDSGTLTEADPVTASENACSYGGTQIYLEPGETMTLGELLKAVSVNSANDAAVALAEFVGGSEEAFVAMMNERAAALGMENTHFVNPCGLPHPDHYTSAYDVALMTRELLKHPHILDYTGIWMDSLRNGGFGLANTNKLLKTYQGMTGMKTGYTQEAGHCLSATATRGDMTLISVILGGASSKGRFSSAAALLDYGFAGYTVVRKAVDPISPVAVTRGTKDFVSVGAEGALTLVMKKGKTSDLTVEVSVESSLQAPVHAGQVVGEVRFLNAGEAVLRVPVVALEEVEKAGFWDYLGTLTEALLRSGS